MTNVMKFIKYYIISMRLHFGFITGIMGWVGISYYEFTYSMTVSLGLKIFFLFAVFTAYGVNQVINDYYGLEEDKLNAPNRPMVTGDLNPKIALYLSVGLMILLCVVSYMIQPLSALPLIAGVLLNLLYEYAKSISIIGNIIFGMSIVTCSIYGFLMAGPLEGQLFTTPRVAIMVYLVIINGLMTYYTYFKDYEGDKEVGKKTFIVNHGVDFAKKIGIFFSIIPSVLIIFFIINGTVKIPGVVETTPFWFCLFISCFLQIWTATLYFKYPTGERTYYNLVTNIQACVSGQVAMIAIFNPSLALYLLAVTYIFIGFVFSLHKDAKA